MTPTASNAAATVAATAPQLPLGSEGGGARGDDSGRGVAMRAVEEDEDPGAKSKSGATSGSTESCQRTAVWDMWGPDEAKEAALTSCEAGSVTNLRDLRA